MYRTDLLYLSASKNITFVSVFYNKPSTLWYIGGVGRVSPMLARSPEEGEVRGSNPTLG